MEEFLAVLKDMPYDHEPSPDGFNGALFKKCWHIILAGSVMILLMEI
jgi:hypothetical protein